MKKVQDYYFKKAKKEKYPARSVYKLEEAQNKFHFMKKNNRVLDLGCHPGSWAIYAAKIVGSQGLVVGVDLHKSKNVAFANSAGIEFLKADIFSPDLVDVITGKPQFAVVVSDLAPKTTGHKFSDHLKSIELSRQALYIASLVLSSGGHFYCKVFQGEDFPVFVSEVRNLFKKVKVVKPKSSRTESREVFVLGLEYKDNS